MWADTVAAKRLLGVLPDGLRLFDRLTGLQLITYAGLLRGMDRAVVAERAGELLAALGLTDAGGKLVVDYSAGMTKKVALACALVHAPRLLVLDEPFEAVDPVSAATIRHILAGFVGSGGTVVLSSHVMDLVAAASAPTSPSSPTAGSSPPARVDDVRAGGPWRSGSSSSSAGATEVEGLAWLRTSSD